MGDVLASTIDDLSKLGLYTGMGDIYIALMETEDTADAPATYAAPILAAEGVSFGVTPNYAEGSQSASDRTIRKVSIPTGYTIKMEYPRMLPAVRSAILGHVRDAKGGEILADVAAPYVAVGYAAHRDDGTSHMRWLYKVRFKERSLDDKTAEDGSVTYGIPILEGDAVKCNNTITAGGRKVHPLRYDADTADKTCTYTEATFFKAVPQYAAEASVP